MSMYWLRHRRRNQLSMRSLGRAAASVMPGVVSVCVLFALIAPSWGTPGVPSAGAQSDNAVGLYEKFEITLDWGVTYENPYNPDEVSVEATFTAPNGSQKTVFGFYYQEFERWVEGNWEEFAPTADPVWMVRFTPTMLGTYTYVVNVVDARGVNEVASGSFECDPSDGDPFVELGPLGTRSYQLSNGQPFIPVGMNSVTTWTETSDYGLDIYNERMPVLGDNGMNIMRTQLTANDMALIWSPGQFDYGVWRYYGGLDAFNLASAWKFDRIMDLSNIEGIRILLNIEQSLALTTNSPIESLGWTESPYNIANGGMVSQPAEFFYNEEAKAVVKRELRYLVARWGYSPIIFGWELFNEFDWVIYQEDFTAEDIDAVLDWHAEMADYLHQIDPYDHPVTTNVATPLHWWTEDGWYFDLWQIPDLDICNFHFYNLPLFTDDTVRNIVDYMTAYFSETAKPCIIGEWGIDANGFADRQDPAGIAMHNALWTATMFKTLLLPHYYRVVEEFNLYGHFKALANYLEEETTDGMADYDVAMPTVSNIQLEALGLIRPDRALIWVHNKQSFHGETEPTVVEGATVSIAGLVPGQYWIEYWDTFSGEITDVQTVIHDREPLMVALPPVNRDLALRVWLQQ